jgi:hypothetical protein
LMDDMAGGVCCSILILLLDVGGGELNLHDYGKRESALVRHGVRRRWPLLVYCIQ